jgi:hypothetical protein
MRSLRVTAFAFALFWFAVPTALRAQQILARVRGTESDGALAGAIVTVLDSNGQAIQSFLTNRDGAATFPSLPIGTYRLRAEMIGRQSVDTEPFTTSSELTVRVVQLPFRPIPLAGLEVSGKPACSLNARDALPAYQVWDEARKALLAAQLTQEAGEYRFWITRHQRQRALNERRTIPISSSTIVRQSTDPFESLSPEEIERTGYVSGEGPRGDLYGPKTDVFLSDGFERTHCFNVRRDGDHKGEIGLRFTLVQGRTIPDIEGTLWLDEGSSELRTLEFEYKNLPRGFGTLFDHGGDMSYRRLEDGRWIVSQWRIFSGLREEAAEVIRIEKLPPPPER